MITDLMKGNFGMINKTAKLLKTDIIVCKD